MSCTCSHMPHAWLAAHITQIATLQSVVAGQEAAQAESSHNLAVMNERLLELDQVGPLSPCWLGAYGMDQVGSCLSLVSGWV